MTQQYLVGELSVLLALIQGSTNSDAAAKLVRSLRHAVETEPNEYLGRVMLRALSLTEGLCWESLARGDAGAFSRQSALCEDLQELGTC